MATDQRGMALVTVIFLLALLMALAQVLTDKVWQSTRSLSRDHLRERSFWAACAGIEWARRELAVRYRVTNNWQTLLSAPTEGYSATPLWNPIIDAIPVELYVRDNPDGDGDPFRDNDLKVLVLARVRHGPGPEVLVESVCGFAAETMTGVYGHPGGNDGSRTEFTAAVAEPLDSFQVND